MPREAWWGGDGKMSFRQYEEPVLAGRQVRIRSQFGAAKHGTELAIVKGYAAHRGRFDPATKVFTHETPTGPSKGWHVGNMTVGVVTEVGPEAKELAVGERVLTYGGFRETHVREEPGCWKIPAELSWKSAVCLDPADFALGAVRDGNVRVGDAVAVFGLGAIGLMAVQIAKAGGASPVIACEPLPKRRELGKRLGADIVLDPSACDAGLEIKKATGGRGADVVIEYSGAWQALQAALRGVAYAGTIVAGAFPPPHGAGLDLGAEAHINIPRIVFSRSCSEPNRDFPRWNEQRIFQACLHLLTTGAITGEAVVTPVVPFGQVLKEYPKIATHPDEYVKLGVEY